MARLPTHITKTKRHRLVYNETLSTAKVQCDDYYKNNGLTNESKQ